jgi:hypothetical protein
MNAMRTLASTLGATGMALLPTAAFAAPHLTIQGVQAGGNTLTILGVGFKPEKKDRLRVFLGEAPTNEISGLCTTPAPTDSTIWSRLTR